MSDERITDELATRVMGWTPRLGRYLQRDRKWTPKWRFQPLKRLDDAFALLDISESQYTIERGASGAFMVEVRIGGCVGRASGRAKARSISVALGRALQIDAFSNGVVNSTTPRRGREETRP